MLIPESLHWLQSNAWPIFLVVMFFGGSIFVHELGHFLAARRQGLIVDRFSIGFGPPIFSWNGRDGVKYQVAWIPLGGYVLLPQLADLGALEGEREPGSSEAPPSVQAAKEIPYKSKMIVFGAGAVFNILFAFALACIIWIIGQPEPDDAGTTRIGYVSRSIDLPNGRMIAGPAAAAGLRAGDVVRAIDGIPVSNWMQLTQTLVTGAGRGSDGEPRSIFTIERDGKTLDIVVRPRISGDDQIRRVGIGPSYDLIVYSVSPGSAAAKAGLKPGDQIVAFNGLPESNIAAFADDLAAVSAKEGVIAVKREGRTVPLALPARDGKHENAGIEFIIGVHLIHPSPFSQISEQFMTVFRTLWSLVSPHSDIGLSKMAGPVGIMHIFHEAAEAGLRSILMFTILINVNLAIFNLLPIPVLDGGHMLFATIGRLRGRALPTDFIMTTQSVFIVLLLSMVLYVSVFDVQRWRRDIRLDHAAQSAAKP